MNAAAALHLRGCRQAARGELETAAATLKRALAREPSRAAWHADLGIIFAAMRDWRAAAEALSRARELAPRDPHIAIHYANALLGCGYSQPACEAYRQLRSTRPETPGLWLGLARSLVGTGRFEEAIRVVNDGLQREPDASGGHELLAGIYKARLRYDLELFHREKALALLPGEVEAAVLAASAACNAGDVDRALALFRKAAALEGDGATGQSAYLSTLLHHEASSARTIVEEHGAWARRLSPARPRRFANSRQPRRRLRVGYVSGETPASPSFCFVSPFLRLHDPARVETFIYHATPDGRHASAELRMLANTWRDVTHESDQEIAALILRDEIDVLVDVSGHYGRVLLGVFRMRTAPVQVAFPSYPATTGLREMDYVLTDRWTCPPGMEYQYLEKPWWLESGYLTWEVPLWASEVRPLPALAAGAITFGLFQRAAKLNEALWDAIGRVLRAVPKSRLLVHFAASDLDAKNSPLRGRIVSSLKSRGISERRMRFTGPRSGNEHLEAIGEADIALDSFPYNGQTTACECLWMGVPVVTLAGEAHVARVGAALLQRAGVGEWVGDSVEDYVAIAVRLASDRKALATLRAGLRQRVRSTSLIDARSLTRQMELAYRRMWSHWCAGFPGKD